MAAAARSLYTALAAIEVLKVAFYPFLPFSSEKLNEMLGHTTRLDAGRWASVRPEPGTALQEPVALFKKLDPLEPAT
jgi:methionyl-tRNA synthetase